MKLENKSNFNLSKLVEKAKENLNDKELNLDNVQQYHNVYSVLDLETQHYDTPFFTRGDIFAKRKFIIDIRNGSYSILSNFKDSFVLARLGKFSILTGEFSQDIKFIMSGKEVSNENSNEA